MGNLETIKFSPMDNTTKEEARTLLNRLVKIGLLTSDTDGYYSIHPALPGYLRVLFKKFYSDDVAKREIKNSAEHVYVQAVGAFSAVFRDVYGMGNFVAVRHLHLNKPNLYNAWSIALEHGWVQDLIAIMQGIQVIESHIEWERMVNLIKPLIFIPGTEKAKPGFEFDVFITWGYLAELAMKNRDFESAFAYRSKAMEWINKQCQPFVQLPLAALNDQEKMLLQNLMRTFLSTGSMLYEIGNKDSIQFFEQAFGLAVKLEMQGDPAVIAHHIGSAYIHLSQDHVGVGNLGITSTELVNAQPANAESNDLTKAYEWFNLGVNICDQNDYYMRSFLYSDLGQIMYIQYHQKSMHGQLDKDEFTVLNKKAEDYYQLALHCLQQCVNEGGATPNILESLAGVTNELGNIYKDIRDVEKALYYYQESIRYEEQRGNRYGAGTSCTNIAILLVIAERYQDALKYYQTALDIYQACGDRARMDVMVTVGRIQNLQQLIASQETKGID